VFSNLRGARILLTGNTGFKGSWMSCLLESFGLEVIGLSLGNEANRLYEELDLSRRTKTYFGDIRDKDFVFEVFRLVKPDVVIHFAAQPIVLDSYSDPTGTLLTNVIGTSHILEAGCSVPNNKATLIITTDKVYRNDETGKAFREEDHLGGADPYSASKACAELVTNVWKSPALNPFNVEIATARAGNVIGGGDSSANRLIPNMVESFLANKPAVIRNPDSVRPWQHVLDPLFGYIILLNQMVTKSNIHTAYNFGPSPTSFLSVSGLANLMTGSWNDGVRWEKAYNSTVELESKFLTIDSERARTELGWKCRLDIQKTVDWIVEWEKSSDKLLTTRSQIESYIQLVLNNSI
jgi:CDP-glucose 4,6-dehydratase